MDCPDEPILQSSLPSDLRDIRRVALEQAGEQEIVVSARDKEDPCSPDNIIKSFDSYPGIGTLSYSVDVDKSYKPGGVCSGRIVENICYTKTNKIYAGPGTTQAFRDPHNEGIIISMKQGECERGESCAFPFPQKQLNILVPFENIYDARQIEDQVVECRPINCYSIALAPKMSYSGNEKYPGQPLITVTRRPDGQVVTKMIINAGFSHLYTTSDTVHGYSGEGGVNRNVIGKGPTTFMGCDEPYAERKR